MLTGYVVVSYWCYY